MNQVIIKQLKFVAYKKVPFSAEEKVQLRKKVLSRCYSYNDLFEMQLLTGCGCMQTLLFFDVYSVESLGFLQRFRYKASKLWTAALRHIGINPFVVVVVCD